MSGVVARVGRRSAVVEVEDMVDVDDMEECTGLSYMDLVKMVLMGS